MTRSELMCVMTARHGARQRQHHGRLLAFGVEAKHCSPP